jgi:hypothetical protein
MMAGSATPGSSRPPARTASALSEGILGGSDSAESGDDLSLEDEADGVPGGGLQRSQSKPVQALTAGMNKVGLTDPKLQAGVIIFLLILGLVLFLAFVAPGMYNAMRVVLEFSEQHLGFFISVLIVGSLAVLCANPVPGSHVTLLFIAYHYGVPVNHEDPQMGGGCESTGFLFLNARAACFTHGAFFLYVVYTIASVVNFTLLRNCCGESANRQAKKKGGDYVIAVDAVISAGGWQTFQAMMLLRLTPVPIGLQTLTLSVTSIGAPIQKKLDRAAAAAPAAGTALPAAGEGEGAAEAAADGTLLEGVLAKRGYEIGWPYLGASLLGNVKLAVFDALVGVNVKELDKAANGGGENNTEVIILMIGLAGLIATIGVVGAWAKRELDRMHRQSVSAGSLSELELGGIDGVDNPLGGAQAAVDEDPIVLTPPVAAEPPQSSIPPPSPEGATAAADAGGGGGESDETPL